MSFFKRKQPCAEIAPAAAEVIVPRYSGDELERMVGETYEEKLRLQAKLKSAEAQLEAMGDVKAKLSSAEVFADQCRRERDSEIREREQVERKIKAIEQESQRCRDRDRDVRNALVYAMADALIYEDGCWSKNRVAEFIDRFRDYVPKEGEL